MLCPRCRLSLSPQEYEGQDVSFCQTCWGHWLTRSQLDTIVQEVAYKFSRLEKKAVLKTMRKEGDADRQGAESQVINCPECDQPMEKKRYAESCPVEIDECGEHGIWLDTGEIKDLQIFVEKHLQ
ncbi:MAG: TFIIB-type zinc ribbon-containing protein [Planctomycetota bacterium]|jgi:Zn-finger nucleic acid-binding protein